jgi:hypothetical protein
MMIVDNLMMLMILGGIALCGAYFRGQYMDWRNQQTAEFERKIRVRLLNAYETVSYDAYSNPQQATPQ